jgi:3-methyladenine DNA glycosylase AlkC
MSDRTLLPLAFLSVLLFVSLSEFSSAQDQAKDEKQEEAIYNGKTVSQWVNELKSSKNSTGRSIAARSLARFGPEAKAAVPALIEALKDEDKATRVSAASSLGQIGPAAKDAVPALIEAVKDKNVFVSSSAASALRQIQRKK